MPFPPTNLQVRNSSLKAIFVFIAPPSLEELEHRLRGRATGALAVDWVSPAQVQSSNAFCWSH
jgi:hypothetical protein